MNPPVPEILLVQYSKAGGPVLQGKVEICGVNTAKLKVLKNEETMALLRRAKAGDREAREELIAGNLRLVLSVLQKFVGRGENVDDLFQVGCIGLIKAIDNFNVDLDVRFSTYGVPMIVGEIRRYLRDNSAVRVSRSIRDTAYRVLQAKEKYMAQHQREPTLDEIARMLELKREDVVMALDAIADPVSLYEPVYSDGADAICVMDQVRDQTVLPGQDPDGGVRRGGHFPGPGVPAGEERHPPHQEKSLGPVSCSPALHFFPGHSKLRTILCFDSEGGRRLCCWPSMWAIPM